MTTIRQRTAALKIMKDGAKTAIGRINNNDRALLQKFSREATPTPTEIHKYLLQGNVKVLDSIDSTAAGAIYQYLDLQDLRDQKIKANWNDELPDPTPNGLPYGANLYLPRVGASHISVRFPRNREAILAIEAEFLRVEDLIEFGSEMNLPKELRDFSLFLTRFRG